MEERITLCGNNRIECPRYNSHIEAELRKVAELWYRVGWRDTVVSGKEIACAGCSSNKFCTYGLVACTEKHGVEKCNQCKEFLCYKITDMLERSKKYHEKCKIVCSEDEYMELEKAFLIKKTIL